MDQCRWNDRGSAGRKDGQYIVKCVTAHRFPVNSNKYGKKQERSEETK